MNTDALFTKIAQQHFDIETLETRNLDRLDFHEVSVGSLKAALKKAYEAGQQSSAKPQ